MADSIMDQLVNDQPRAGCGRILVVGIGGGGGNAVKNMMDQGLTGVEFICANTDLQALEANPAPTRIQLGEKLTRGLGAGSDPVVGRDAALESQQALEEALAGADMVFVTAGMGGGTGTGAAPVVAEIARAQKSLTVAVVTRPFSHEGRKRIANAQAGIDELSRNVDCLIIIPNDRLMACAPKKTPLRELLARANDVLFYGVKGISDVITHPGFLNLDLMDVRTCMSNEGLALMGMGTGKGENRAEEAVNGAIQSPLLEDISLSTAKAVLYNITAPEDITGEETEVIAEKIHSSVPDDANIFFGLVFDNSLDDEIRVTVVATGIEAQPELGEPPAAAPQPSPRKTPAAPQEPAAKAEPQPAVVSRQDFRESSRKRWAQEKGVIPKGDDYPYPGSGGFGGSDINYDETRLEVPTFIRKGVD